MSGKRDKKFRKEAYKVIEKVRGDYYEEKYIELFALNNNLRKALIVVSIVAALLLVGNILLFFF